MSGPPNRDTQDRLVVRPGQGRRFDALGAPVFRLVHPLTVGSENLGVSLCEMEPGSEIRRHSHDYEEAYYVLAGTGLMYLESAEAIRLEPGLSVYVPAGRVHGQVNDGTEELRILCALSPPPVEGEPPRFADPTSDDQQ
jgi:quercetin dioxygenase-like cupin family protein